MARKAKRDRERESMEPSVPGVRGAPYGWEAAPGWPARGSRLRSVRAMDLLLKETAFPPGSRIPRHEHALSKVTLALAGSCTEEREGKTFRYRPSTLQVNPPGSSHAYRAGGEGLRVFSVTLGPAWEHRLSEPSLDPLVASRDAHLVSLAWRLHQESLRPDDLSPLVMEELVTHLVDRVCRCGGEEASGPPWLEELLALLQDTFTEARGLSDYAARVGVDRSHLARSFRARFHCTLGEYLRGLRLARARVLLLETDRPMAEIALQAGFCDQSHMGRTFRRLVGSTPGHLRRTARTKTRHGRSS